MELSSKQKTWLARNGWTVTEGEAFVRGALTIRESYGSDGSWLLTTNGQTLIQAPLKKCFEHSEYYRARFGC